MDAVKEEEARELGARFAKEIESGFIAKVSVRWINDVVGSGLFLEEDLDVGCYVGEYTGVVRKNNLRYLEPLNNYCYEYPALDEIGRSYVIDATAGNLTRFINHSFKPNLQPLYAFHNGLYHLIFLTLYPIEKERQLSYNYGKNYWYIREKPQEL